ncbi:DUF2848 family protein [Streptomyces sp. NPDC058391]|uniref:DUF2848 family protein n=1 Tax=Streptomyces sp. NPDC058391 TaxID=3346476 RepID=UPI0036603FD1
MAPRLELRVAGSDEEVVVRPRQLIVAGYTGRDETAVRAHIAELAEIGVEPPPTVPMFYTLDPRLLTTDENIAVAGEHTSGEVEPVLIRAGGRWYLAVGSDHTDRELERRGVLESKAVCPKPVGASVLALSGEPSSVDLDAVRATSAVDGRAYQDGTLGGLRTPGDLWRRALDALTPDALAPDAGDLALFCGTLPLLHGRFEPGRRWDIALTMPGRAHLAHTYHVGRRRP